MRCTASAMSSFGEPDLLTPLMPFESASAMNLSTAVVLMSFTTSLADGGIFDARLMAMP